MARTDLTADTTFYVRTDGNDSNDGSANDSAHAWLTIQHGYNWIAHNIDCRGYLATLQVGDGTYSAGVNNFGVSVGGGTGSITGIAIQGNLATPSNCIINATSNHCFSTTFNNLFVRGGFKLMSVGSAFYASACGSISIKGPINYGTCGQYHKHANVGGSIIEAGGDFTISGNADSHMMAQHLGCIEVSNPCTVTLSGSPVFKLGYACAMGGYVFQGGGTFSGSVGGGSSPHYGIYFGGFVDTSGSNNFPGNTAGINAGGYYN